MWSRTAEMGRKTARGNGKSRAELVQKLTPEEKTALVCGRSSSGSKEIIGAAAVTVPGAAGETTASLLEKYGVANVILADGPAGIRITTLSEKKIRRTAVFTR